MGLIRVLLAISVVIAHTSRVYGFGIVGGQVAVQAFYIISGFYMSLILNEKYIGKNNSYKLFITNRLLRLYPIYWIVLLITLLVSLVIFTFSSEVFAEGKIQLYYDNFDSMSLGSFLFLIITNIIMLFQDFVMFLGLDTASRELFFTTNFRETSPQLWTFLFVPQAWTIGVEITFYLIAPFLVRKKISVIFFVLAISAFLRLLLYTNGLQNDPWTYRFFPTELLFFLLGTIAYHIYKKIDPLNIKTSYLKIIYVTILFFTLVYTWIPFQNKIYIYFFTFFLSLPFIFILSKNWVVDRYIGELSYPIYISHMLILLLIKYMKLPLIENLGLATIILSILFSILLNEYVAKRIERIRQGRVRTNNL